MGFGLRFSRVPIQQMCVHVRSPTRASDLNGAMFGQGMDGRQGHDRITEMAGADHHERWPWDRIGSR